MELNIFKQEYYNGKVYYRADYSNLTESQVYDRLVQADKDILESGLDGIYILNDFRNSFLGPKVSEYIKSEPAKKAGQHVKKMVVLSIPVSTTGGKLMFGIKKMFFNSFCIITGMNAQMFSDEKEALNWLLD